jgi:Tol biopolymer transport system component
MSLAGAIGFFVAGLLDFAWHSLFGFEVSVEALLSPSHLALAASGVLMFSGPIRSVWSATTATAAPSWRRHGPAVIGLAALLSIFAAFTQYAHPVVDPWSESLAGRDARRPQAQLFAMAADGTGQRRLLITDEDDRNPRLSPDGGRLVFTANVERSAQIVVSTADGSNRREVTSVGDSGGPAWSPDGRRIAFHSDRSGSFDVYTMAADGSDVRPLTTEPSTDWGPAWSPDGTMIAFTSDRAGPGDIYSVRADGTDLIRLTQTSGADYDAAWSPDGTRIAFASEGADGDVEIVSMAAGGTDLRRLTDAEDSSFMPAWSPDGKSIAFTTNRDGDLEVYVMNTDGTNPRNLTRSFGIADGLAGPSWSPDGRSILYPSQGVAPYWQVDDVRQGFGAAGILIQAALLAGFVLVALRRGPLPFGALTLLLFAPTALMTIVSDEYRFLPGAFVAGLSADLLVRRLPYGSTRRTDAVIAFAIPAVFYAAYFATVQLTSGIGWTIHLWLGAIVIAGIIGVVLEVLMRMARPPSPWPSPA